MNMNDYPAGPHRFEGPTSEQRIAELEKELYLVRADAKQAMFEAEKAMAQIREATEKVVAERNLFFDQHAPLTAELAKVKADLEIERMRLVACGVVALSDTPSSAKSAREMHQDYRSASLSDVERRVDECIQLRTERDAAVAQMRTAINMIDAGSTKQQVRVWLEGYCDAAKETK